MIPDQIIHSRTDLNEARLRRVADAPLLGQPLVERDDAALERVARDRALASLVEEVEERLT
jgi:hypothetical protein